MNCELFVNNIFGYLTNIHSWCIIIHIGQELVNC
nr:MAG TPA: hypothetical protein [Caudoviricetes sp.]